MSDLCSATNFVEGSGTTTAVAALPSGVTSGNAIVVAVLSGSGSPTTTTVSDGDGAYTFFGSSSIDSGDGVWLRMFGRENCSAGTHTITVTMDSGFGVSFYAQEVGSSGTGVIVGGSTQFQNAGGGTDAISSGTVTGITGAATLIGFSVESSYVDATKTPNIGSSGFTDRQHGANGNIGSWRVESAGVASNAAALFNHPAGEAGSPTVTGGIAILNSGSGGGDTFLGQIML